MILVKAKGTSEIYGAAQYIEGNYISGLLEKAIHQGLALRPKDIVVDERDRLKVYTKKRLKEKYYVL